MCCADVIHSYSRDRTMPPLSLSTWKLPSTYMLLYSVTHMVGMNFERANCTMVASFLVPGIFPHTHKNDRENCLVTKNLPQYIRSYKLYISSIWDILYSTPVPPKMGPFVVAVRMQCFFQPINLHNNAMYALWWEAGEPYFKQNHSIFLGKCSNFW